MAIDALTQTQGQQFKVTISNNIMVRIRWNGQIVHAATFCSYSFQDQYMGGRCRCNRLQFSVCQLTIDSLGDKSLCGHNLHVIFTFRKQNNILNLVIYIEGLRHWVLLDCRVTIYSSTAKLGGVHESYHRNLTSGNKVNMHLLGICDPCRNHLIRFTSLVGGESLLNRMRSWSESWLFIS